MWFPHLGITRSMLHEASREETSGEDAIWRRSCLKTRLHHVLHDLRNVFLDLEVVPIMISLILWRQQR